ncbi:MAG: hypothetical protein QF827_11745 [Alphaproteobacteria bacterium]|jgi:hypothetical protein|nr:hypothetical protein [Alphaproteobacteria bacterium]
MRKLFATALVLAVAAGCAQNKGMIDKKMLKGAAQAHIGHVVVGWKDTPGKKGLLTTAIAEAKIAAQHAGFAVKKLDDLKWVKAHVGHVLHAVDPSAIAKGPGLGYGVVKAATGAAKHINFAAKSKDASKNVKTHAVHVSASATNAAEWAKDIAAIAQGILAAGSAAEAKMRVQALQRMADRLLKGVDANNDGKITWKPGEGGLNEAKKHMGFMTKGEGLTS